MSKFKVGDRVRHIQSGDLVEILDICCSGDVRVKWLKKDREGGSFWPQVHFEPATPSPVRVKTTKEIVPGVYGRVVVEGETYKRGSTGERQLAIDFAPRNAGGVMPTHRHRLTATELREAAKVFEQLAEALEDE